MRKTQGLFQIGNSPDRLTISSTLTIKGCSILMSIILEFCPYEYPYILIILEFAPYSVCFNGIPSPTLLPHPRDHCLGK